MLAAVVAPYLDRASQGLGGSLKPPGLFQQHEPVGVAMIDQGRRQVGRDVVDGRGLSPDYLPDRKVCGLRSKRLDETLGRPAVTWVLR